MCQLSEKSNTAKRCYITPFSGIFLVKAVFFALKSGILCLYNYNLFRLILFHLLKLLGTVGEPAVPFLAKTADKWIFEELP